MLSFLFEPASSGCQFVLFFTTFTSCSKRHFTNRCHVVYYTAQLLQFFSDRCQFSWISGKIVSIPTPRLSTVKSGQFINSIPHRTNKLFSLISKQYILISFTYLCFIPWSCTSPLNTGSTISFNVWGSSIFVSITIFCPFGPFACTLYIQKCRSFLFPPPPDDPAEVERRSIDGPSPSKSLSSIKRIFIVV